jgi:NAD(P)-dependent dehydrogenase (short-subunit alcohol dehydrogenase family)
MKIVDNYKTPSRAGISRTPLGRIGTSSDIADVVAFLASPDAHWVTGQVLDTTGGLAPKSKTDKKILRSETRMEFL